LSLSSIRALYRSRLTAPKELSCANDKDRPKHAATQPMAAKTV
jgi:hypothetical protein